MHIYLYNNGLIEDRDESIRRCCRQYAKDTGAASLLKFIDTAAISHRVGGKPFFRDGEQIHFSLSHSGSIWGCAVDSDPVGFDIEDTARFEKGRRYKQPAQADSRWLKIAERFFTDSEYEYVKAGGKKAFFELWVRKEAFLKYKGGGLSMGLKSIELVSGGHLISELPGGWVREVIIGSGFMAAYCAAEKREVERMVDYRKQGDKD